ncbi:MAG TPA: helix-turn-helix transcriptional regulator [bacterium]|nr:helix-turn-helix transcriptional regulator [bacterium]
MAKPFKTLLQKMSPESQKKVREKTDRLLKEVLLKELRETRKITQEDVAEILEVKQSSVSKIENRGPSISIGVLENYIHALGGELELRARFKDGTLPFSVSKEEEVA